MKTIIIGSQEWTTENLDVTHFRNGNKIEECWDYNKLPVLGKTFGKLYSWNVVNDPRGLAPEGFHIPTDEEWGELINNTTFEELINSKFSVLPGGWRCYDGTFNNIGSRANFWSSTELNNGFAWYRYLNYYDSDIYRLSYSKRSGFSIRCIRD